MPLVSVYVHCYGWYAVKSMLCKRAWEFVIIMMKYHHTVTLGSFSFCVLVPLSVSSSSSITQISEPRDIQKIINMNKILCIIVSWEVFLSQCFLKDIGHLWSFPLRLYAETLDYARDENDWMYDLSEWYQGQFYRPTSQSASISVPFISVCTEIDSVYETLLPTHPTAASRDMFNYQH